MTERAGPGPEITALLAAAVTGAPARLISSSADDRDRVDTLEMDWGRSPGASDLPDRVLIRLGPHGDYEARLEGARDAFASGVAQETLVNPATVRIGALIRVTDEGLFRTKMDVFGGRAVSASDLDGAMLCLPVEAASAGIAGIGVSDISVEGSEIYFEVTAVVSDPGMLVRAAREAYTECWWDNTWFPRTPQEALFELALGSNENPSPSDMGFEFLDYPETRDAERIREAADSEVSASPALIPEERLTYPDWLELTGLDDSFVGDGRERPGTRDLFDAAIRALPDPDDVPSP